MTVALLAVFLLAPAPAPPDCDALYAGGERPRDLPAALACFRDREDWTMVTILLLNGEGAPVDLVGARAAYQKLLKEQGGQPDADAEALGAILRRREAKAKPAGRVDFCRDVAQTTISVNACQAEEDRGGERRARELVAKLRTGLAPAQQKLLDEVAAAAVRLIEADGQRMYQQYLEGSVRNTAALLQQRAVRKNYLDRLGAWVVRRRVPAAARPFEEADRELNAVYKEATGAADPAYKTKARDAQRAWVRYRDAFARLVSALQPGAEVERAVRSLITDDRIAELKHDPVAPE